MNIWVNDFPILKQKINGQRLVYLDNAATSQKPIQVINAITDYYTNYNANVHRGLHTLSTKTTEKYEGSRQTIADFIGASFSEEIIFTSGTTASLNLLANSYGKSRLAPGDEILITIAEHHSNILPWQQVAKATGATLRYLELTESGEVCLEKAKKTINSNTKILSIHHVSNVLGSVTPVKALANLIHAMGGIIIVDGAQSVGHMPVDVKELDADFFCFSGHKMCGPTGIGVLYGKKALLEEMSPITFGGEMTNSVSQFSAEWKELPWKLEAGTPNIAAAIGLGAAVKYLTSIGMNKIEEHGYNLTKYALERLMELRDLKIYGPHQNRIGAITFNLGKIHPHDLATVLDAQSSIAIRAGLHCAHPLIKWLGEYSTARASFYLYNTEEDADALVQGLIKTKEFFENVN